MEKGLTEAFGVIEWWVQLVLQTLVRSVLLPFDFIEAMFT